MQEFVDEMNNIWKKEREENCQLNLQGLIEELEKLPDEAKKGIVEVDMDGFDDIYVYATDIDSYRGYYSDLQIEYSQDIKEALTTEELIKKLKKAIGKTFYGYKGGEFEMHVGTVVWLSNYWKTSNRQVIGVINGWDRCYLKSKRVE